MMPRNSKTVEHTISAKGNRLSSFTAIDELVKHFVE